MTATPQRPLTPSQARIVEAAAARILPTTDTPGATEAGVVDYIQRLLAEAFPRLAPLYRAGCVALDRHARARFVPRFPQLQPDAQDAVLRDFEAGNVPSWRRAAEFFETLLRHTMEGVFGEPSYGGNRDLAGWRLVGFPGQQFGYADAYDDRPVHIEPSVDTDHLTEEQAVERALRFHSRQALRQGSGQARHAFKD